MYTHLLTETIHMVGVEIPLVQARLLFHKELYKHMHACMHTRNQPPTPTHTHTQTHTHRHSHTHTHTHTHSLTLTHTHTHPKSQHSYQVTQFHVTNWSPDGTCSNLKVITDVIEEVAKVQRRTGNNPILVHCRYSLKQ